MRFDNRMISPVTLPVLAIVAYSAYGALAIRSIPSNPPEIYTNRWIVEIEGGIVAAKKLAEKNGFSYRGQIFDDYHELQHRHVLRRDIRPNAYPHRLLSANPDVKWTQQEMLLQRSLMQSTTDFTEPEDPEWDKQWYLKEKNSASLNVYGAWKMGYTGKGIAIIVVDMAMVRHDDLYLDSRLNKTLQPADPLFPQRENNHANSVAGVIAAQKNGICGVGIAYNSILGNVGLFGAGLQTTAMEAQALTAFLKIDDVAPDIYSNSWSVANIGSLIGGQERVIKQAIEKGIREGRFGLGSIYVWAAGNGGKNMDNCGYDGYVSSRYTIGVAGVTSTYKPLATGEKCSAILAVTFSKNRGDQNPIVTVSSASHDGCYDDFSESSAAAPMASGIIALTLEANRNLTWRDVQHLIVYTSQPNLPFEPRDFIVNGGGLYASPSYGFGLMNAERMVKLAKFWKNVPRQLNCSLLVNSTMIELPGSSNATVDLSKCNIKFIEHVEIGVTLNFTHRGALSLTLVSPSDTKIKIGPGRASDFARDLDWVFTSFHFWGESPTSGGKANWTLEGIDVGSQFEDFLRWALPESQGFLFSWNVTLYGTNSTPASFYDQDLPDEILRILHLRENGNDRNVKSLRNALDIHIHSSSNSVPRLSVKIVVLVFNITSCLIVALLQK